MDVHLVTNVSKPVVTPTSDMSQLKLKRSSAAVRFLAMDKASMASISGTVISINILSRVHRPVWVPAGPGGAAPMKFISGIDRLVSMIINIKWCTIGRSTFNVQCSTSLRLMRAYFIRRLKMSVDIFRYPQSP